MNHKTTDRTVAVTNCFVYSRCRVNPIFFRDWLNFFLTMTVKSEGRPSFWWIRTMKAIYYNVQCFASSARLAFQALTARWGAGGAGGVFWPLRLTRQHRGRKERVRWDQEIPQCTLLPLQETSHSSASCDIRSDQDKFSSWHVCLYNQSLGWYGQPSHPVTVVHYCNISDIFTYIYFTTRTLNHIDKTFCFAGNKVLSFGCECGAVNEGLRFWWFLDL